MPNIVSVMKKTKSNNNDIPMSTIRAICWMENGGKADMPG